MEKIGMSTQATGTFEVKVSPLALHDATGMDALGRMSLDKQFSGDLQGTGKGEMLTAGSSVKGSGAYVAIERVTGTLHGRSGSFALQHNGTMAGGVFQLKIAVAPDSGTGELLGLAGNLSIKIADGRHYYDFEYTLEKAT